MKTEQRSKKHTGKLNLIHQYRAEIMIRILKTEVVSIRYVKEWARITNVSREWLKKVMKTVYGKSPKLILREVRYEKILQLILQKGAEANSHCIALESGVGESSDALYKFLSRHYDTTFTRLKKDLLTGELEADFIWLEWKESGSFFLRYQNGRQIYRNRR